MKFNLIVIKKVKLNENYCKRTPLNNGFNIKKYISLKEKAKSGKTYKDYLTQAIKKEPTLTNYISTKNQHE